MEEYRVLLKNNIEERNRIKDEIKELEEDIFKYQNRGDLSSASHCIEKKGYLRATLSKIENEIVRLERIIKNDGVDPYSPVPVSNNSPSESNNLPIDDGTITTSMQIDVTFNGTKGSGENQQTIKDTYSQTVERTSDIKNNRVVSQQTSVDNNSSRQSIRNSSTNLLTSSSRNNIKRKNKKRPQQHNNGSNFIKANEIREKQKMELFISYFKKGKTWKESAKFSNVTPGKASKWYRQGKNNFSNNTRFFYGQIKYIEKHGFSEDNDIPSVNKFDSISKKAKKDERKKMNLFITYLKRGYNWEKSLKLSKIPSTLVTFWYRQGSNNFNENTSYFYSQIKKLNISPNLINASILKETSENVSNPEHIDVEVADESVENENNIIIDVNVVSEDNDMGKDETIKSDEDLIDDKRSKMNLIIFNLKEGKSLEKSSEIAGVSMDVVNTWIVKGKNGDVKYIDFYKEYESLRSNISEEYLKLDRVNKDDYSLENRIYHMDLIHNDFNNIKSFLKDIDEKMSQEEFKSRLENSIMKFKMKNEEKIREVEINRKIISNYANDDSKSIEDFEDKKIQIKEQLNGIYEEIRDAGLRNKHALVFSLQNKKARYKIQILKINDILLLLSKQEILDQDINEINGKINDLKQKLDNIQDERKQMDKFLDAYRESQSCENAAKSVNIKIQRIINWIHDGIDQNNFNKIYFYNEFNKIKDEKELCKIKFKRISQILAQLRKGKTLNQACIIVNVPSNDVNKWYEDGATGDCNLNIDFYNQVNEIKSMNIFLDNFKSTKSIKKTIKSTNITQKQYNQWYNDGNEGVNENTIWFKKQIDDVELNFNPKIQMDNVLSEMRKGKSRFNAAHKFKIRSSKVKEWYDLGEKGYSDETVYFFNEVNKIEPRDNELQNMNKILKELQKDTPLNEAANIVGIPVNLVKVWKDNGKHGLNDNTIYFYKKYHNIYYIKNKYGDFDEKERNNMNKILNLMLMDYSMIEAALDLGIDISTVKKWYDLGEKDYNENTIYFFNEVNKIEPRDNEIENMNKILEELKNGKSLELTIKNAGIRKKLIYDWLDYGKYEFNDNAIYFYNQYHKIKNNEVAHDSYSSNSGRHQVKNKPKINYYGSKNSFEKKQRENMQSIISEMKKGSSRFEAAEKLDIPESNVKKWYNQGKEGYSNNTIYFYRNINLIEPTENEIERMNMVIYAVKNGKSLKEAAKTVKVPVHLVNSWFDNGKHGLNKNTVYFYKQIQNEYQKEFYSMGRVLDALNNGMNKYEACKIAGVSESKLNDWIKQGRTCENKNAEYFIEEFDKLKINDEKNQNNNEKSNSKSCPQCGKQVDMAQNYCNYCGYKLISINKKKGSIFDKLKGIF